MYWLRTEHACNRAIFGSSPICSQCLSARDVSQACWPGKRLIYSNRLLRNSIAVKFQVEPPFRPASKLFYFLLGEVSGRAGLQASVQALYFLLGEISGRAGLQASVQALYFLLGVGFSRRHRRRGTNFSAPAKPQAST